MIGNLRSFCYTGKQSQQDGHNKTVTAAEGPVKKESNIMYRENFKTELPQFSDKQVLISELGAVSGTFSDEAGRQNAKIINRAIRELSEHGGGTLVIPAGIWASAPIRLLSYVRLHLDSQALLKFIKSREDYPLVGSPAMKVRTASAPYLPLPRRARKTSRLPVMASLTAAVINGVRSRSLR